MQAEGGAAGFVEIVAHCSRRRSRALGPTAARRRRRAPPALSLGDVMAMGLGVLGLAPGAFWAMTPTELEAAIRGRFGQVGCEAPLRGPSWLR